MEPRLSPRIDYQARLLERPDQSGGGLRHLWSTSVANSSVLIFRISVLRARFRVRRGAQGQSVFEDHLEILLRRRKSVRETVSKIVKSAAVLRGQISPI